MRKNGNDDDKDDNDDNDDNDDDNKEEWILVEMSKHQLVTRSWKCSTWYKTSDIHTHIKNDGDDGDDGETLLLLSSSSWVRSWVYTLCSWGFNFW